MSKALAKREESCLIVVDLQDSFLAPIARKEEIVKRAKFLIEIANLLEIPLLATEQYPEKMGHLTRTILEILPPSARCFGKMCFSSYGAEGFENAWSSLKRSQAIIVGIETHICVTQTVFDFLNMQNVRDVIVCFDAMGSRLNERDELLALERLRVAGAVLAHTESVAYEWLGQAGTEEFRKALEIVKRYS
ncbi:MAG TPA: isochorismatase family protein [Fimbriimonadales bacterium]|nr:isochorismatase family protein [Fimbriimonadales bacterium]